MLQVSIKITSNIVQFVCNTKDALERTHLAHNYRQLVTQYFARLPVHMSILCDFSYTLYSRARTAPTAHIFLHFHTLLNRLRI